MFLDNAFQRKKQLWKKKKSIYLYSLEILSVVLSCFKVTTGKGRCRFVKPHPPQKQIFGSLFVLLLSNVVNFQDKIKKCVFLHHRSEGNKWSKQPIRVQIFLPPGAVEDSYLTEIIHTSLSWRNTRSDINNCHCKTASPSPEVVECLATQSELFLNTSQLFDVPL